MNKSTPDIFATSRLLASAALLLGLAMVAIPAAAQTAYDALRFSDRQPGVSTRSIGMGGVGVAGLGDFSAVFTNPAGLGLMKRSEMSGSLNIYSVTDDGAYSVGNDLTPFENDFTDTRLGSLAYTHKFPTSRGSLVMAMGLSQVQTFSRELAYGGENSLNSATDYFMPVPGEFEIDTDNGPDGVFGTADDLFFPSFSRSLSFIAFELFAIDFDADAFDAGADVPFFPAVTAGTVRQSGTVTETGAMTEFNLAGAFEAAPNVFVGGSLNVPYGKWELDRFLAEDDEFNDNDGTNGTVDFDFLEWSQFVESELVGINLRAGVAMKTDQGVRAGLSIETPTYYTIAENYATVMTVGFDDGYVDTYGDSESEDVGAGEFEYNIISPWRFAGGLGYSTGDFLVMVDGEIVDWSKLELDSEIFSFEGENRFIRQNFETVVNLRAGAEYRFDNITARIGVANNSDPVELMPNQIDPDLGTIDRERAYFSAGLSFAPNQQFLLDLAWSQERFDDRFLPYDEVTSAPVVTEEIVRNRFSAGVRFRF